MVPAVVHPAIVVTVTALEAFTTAPLTTLLAAFPAIAAVMTIPFPIPVTTAIVAIMVTMALATVVMAIPVLSECRRRKSERSGEGSKYVLHGILS